MRYFITFTCYGGHLHGDVRGSVDRGHNVFGSRVVGADAGRTAMERQQIDQAPYEKDCESRAIVLAALQEVWMHRG